MIRLDKSNGTPVYLSTAEYQTTCSAVNISTTPSEQYSYNLMFGSTNNSRLVRMIYPNGRVLAAGLISTHPVFGSRRSLEETSGQTNGGVRRPAPSADHLRTSYQLVLQKTIVGGVSAAHG